MKWEWPLLIMKQHEDCRCHRKQGSGANEQHCEKTGLIGGMRGGGAVLEEDSQSRSRVVGDSAGMAI